jgi:hypothetical protein
MTNHQESELSKSIYQAMQLKDTDELLAIWVKNDRSEWTDETFSIVHDLLFKRLGSIPQQNPRRPRRKPHEKAKAKFRIPSIFFLYGVPAVLFFLFLWLAAVNNPLSDDTLFGGLSGLSFALMLILPGVSLGHQYWFQGERTRRKVEETTIPKMKETFGVFYRLFSMFLPDRFFAAYLFYSGKFMSIAMIIFGIGAIVFLIDFLSH